VVQKRQARDEESEVEDHRHDDDTTKMLADAQDVMLHHCGFCDIDVSTVATQVQQA